jgi:hypothetical protein
LIEKGEIMRKNSLILGLFFGLLLSFNKAFAVSDYARSWLSLGNKGEDRSLSYGTRSEKFGIEIGFSFKNNIPNRHYLDYPSPDPSTFLYKKHDNAYGMDFLWFQNPTFKTSFYAGLGGYFTKYKNFATSNVDGLTYVQDDHFKFQVPISIGLQHIPTSRTVFAVGYHSIRGANLAIGFNF